MFFGLVLSLLFRWIDDDEDLPNSLREQLDIQHGKDFTFDIEVEGDGENLEKKLASEPVVRPSTTNVAVRTSGAAARVRGNASGAAASGSQSSR